MRLTTIVVVAAACCLLPASASASGAQGCGLVTKSELHKIFHGNVKLRPGETKADCNFFAPKTSNVLLSVGAMSRARFDHLRRIQTRVARAVDVSGLGGPAYFADPNDPADLPKLGFGLLILHGRYQIQIDATAIIDQLGETKQATHAQVKQLARIIVRRAAR